MKTNIQTLKKALREALKEYLIDANYIHKSATGKTILVKPISHQYIKTRGYREHQHICFTSDIKKIGVEWQTNRALKDKLWQDMTRLVKTTLATFYSIDKFDGRTAQADNVEFSFKYGLNQFRED